MTLLDWLQNHPDSHIVSECFDVHEDLLHAKKHLGERAHLLPMSDDCLLNFTLGLALNGSRPILQWPTVDISSICGWMHRIPKDFSGTIFIRISCEHDEEKPIDNGEQCWFNYRPCIAE